MVIKKEILMASALFLALLAAITLIGYCKSINAFAGSVGTTSATANFYVSPEGSDSNPGTLEQPVKTINKAKEVVRNLTDGLEGDIIVWLRGGRAYALEDTLVFTEERLR
ncbi:MAG TPA: hypothetical protein GXX36_09535 [Clostridiaceae bacterium]|nr:hypothetical protein [Clostridiaceae bacterium]